MLNVLALTIVTLAAQAKHYCCITGGKKPALLIRRRKSTIYEKTIALIMANGESLRRMHMPGMIALRHA